MNFRKLIKVILFLSVPCISLNAFQIQSDSIIASAGNKSISVQEFRLKYELIPQTLKMSKDEKKENLLYSLIAEKLWAQEAEELKLDTTEVMNITFKFIEKMLVRDALFNLEIKNKITISEEELTDAMFKHFTTLYLGVLYSPDSAGIYDLYSKLNSGAEFDSLYSINEFQLPALEVNSGEMKKEIENELFKLDEGKYSSPVKSNNGWMIFLVEKKIQKSFTSEDINKTLSKVKNALEEEKTDSLYRTFKSSFLNDKKIEADGNLFWAAADKIISILQQKKKLGNIPDSIDVRLETADIISIENQLGTDTLAMPFIIFDFDPLTMKEFLRSFAFEGFYTTDVDEKIIAAKLNSRVRTLIEQELLAHEGYKRGLQNLPEVKNAINLWRENYLAKLYKNYFVNNTDINVTDNDSAKIIFLNILEILTDSLNVIEKILDENEKGTDFRELAERYSKNNNYESGYFPSSERGEIGTIASSMEVGEVYGPVLTDNGYLIFKLIDKKEDNLIPGANTSEEVRRNLKLQKLSEKIIEKTVQLARKHGIKINSQLLNSISVKDFNMFAIRYMGFGGRLPAVPSTFRFTEWVDDWMRSLHENP